MRRWNENTVYFTGEFRGDSVLMGYKPGEIRTLRFEVVDGMIFTHELDGTHKCGYTDFRAFFANWIPRNDLMTHEISPTEVHYDGGLGMRFVPFAGEVVQTKDGMIHITSMEEDNKKDEIEDWDDF